MIVSGLPPIGCLPVVMAENSPILRNCIQHMNLEAESYNQKLSNLLQQMQAELPGSKIPYADTYTPLMDMINNPQRYGNINL
jgi:phospholipase/lecithinase/hemolysin